VRASIFQSGFAECSDCEGVFSGEKDGWIDGAVGEEAEAGVRNVLDIDVFTDGRHFEACVGLLMVP
jgi:hypothetical protein